MADGKVVIDVILDDGRVVKGVADIDGQLKGIGKAGRNAAVGVGKIVTALGLVALAKKGIDLVRDSMQGAFRRIDTFEQFERVMNAITGSTEETAKALDRTNDIVTDTAYTLDGAARAVQNFVARGASVDDATRYIEAWGDAVAFYGDGSEEQFQNVTDALAKMLTKGKVDMQQLNRLFESGIPAVEIYAQATGESAEDVQAALSNGEISAEKFIDTVSTAMLEGTNGVVNISGAAKDMGSTWGSTFANMRTAVSRGVANVIESIDEMLEDNGLPNMREMVSDFGKTFENVLNWVADMTPTVGGYIQDMRERFDEWKTAISGVMENFSPLFETLRDASRMLWDSFAPIWESLKNLFESLMPILTALGAIIGGVVVVALGLVISTTSAIMSAIGPLINAVINLADVFVNVFNAIIALLVGDFDAALEFWNNATESAIEFFKSLWDGVVNFFSTFIETIIDFFKGLYDTLVGNSIIPDMVNAIIDWFKNLGKWAIEKVTEMVKRVVKFFTDMKDKAIEKATELYTNARNKFNEIKQAISNRINEAKTALINRFTEMVTNARNKATEIVNTARQKFREVVNRIKERMREAVQEVARRIGEMPGKVRDKASQMFSAGKDLVQGLINGIKNMGRNAIEAITGVVGGVIDKAKNLLKISSPSRIFEEFGQALSEGLSVGIEDGTRKAVRSTENLAHGVTRAFSADVGLQNRLRGVSLPLSRMVPAFATPATAEVRAILSSPSQEQKVVIHPSVVLMDGREVGRIVWDPVKEEIDRDANIKEWFRG